MDTTGVERGGEKYAFYPSQHITGRFGLGGSKAMTLAEVGQRIGRSRERVRQIENSAVKRLRRRYLAVSRPSILRPPVGTAATRHATVTS